MHVRPQMEAEAREVDRPHDVRDVREDERARRRSVGRADDRRVQPLGRVLGDALLEEGAALRAVRKALHQSRPPACGAHQRLGDGQVVAHEVELRLATFREQDLVRARDDDASPRDVEHVLLVHGGTVAASD